MASTAHKNPEDIIEHEESESSLDQKAQQLAEWLRNSKHAIIFTGAGISTSAGIPDFRGPDGVWTLRAQGRSRTGPTTSTLKAIPTYTHMAILKLLESGLVKGLVSQNTDGLHRKSGVNPEQFAELHGCTNLEKCLSCHSSYLRDFHVRRYGNDVHDHITGRKCPKCQGDLVDSIINFGENLPERDLSLGFAHGKLADLCISLGSSLTVTPAADIPKRVGKAKYNGQTNRRLVICNLQNTPLDPIADLRVFGKTDALMQKVMKHLNIDVPEWRLNRRIRVFTQYNYDIKRHEVLVDSVDIDGTPASVLAALSGSVDENLVGKLTSEPFHLVLPCLKSVPVKLTLRLTFMGHYHEPDYDISFQLHNSKTCKTFHLQYNPFVREWNEVEPSPTTN